MKHGGNWGSKEAAKHEAPRQPAGSRIKAGQGLANYKAILYNRVQPSHLLYAAERAAAERHRIIMTENGTSGRRSASHMLSGLGSTASGIIGSLRARFPECKPACRASAEHVPFAIHHANIIRTRKDIDGLGMKEGSVDNDMSVVISEDGTIKAVFPSSDTARMKKIPAGYRSIDAQGRYIMPGLINAHVHVFGSGRRLSSNMGDKGPQKTLKHFTATVLGRAMIRRLTRYNIRQQLLSGVTTVRTLGDIAYDLADLRDDIQDGTVMGPRILASGPLLSAPGGHGAPLIALECPDEESALANVHILLDNGANAVKIAATGGVIDSQEADEAGRPQMSESLMRIICTEAHKAGIIVAAHAQSLEGVKAALRAGVDTIEHGSDLDKEAVALFRHNPGSLKGYSALIPTLSTILAMVSLDQDKVGINDTARANAERIAEHMLAGYREAVAKNLHIGVGTDAAMPYVTQYNTWRELDFLVRYTGMTPAQAIYAATAGNAEILNISDVTGSLDEGLSADLLVTEGNPLENLRTLNNPSLVVTHGIPVWRPHARHIAEIDEELDTL